MGYHLNCLDEPVFMAVPKPMLTDFGTHHMQIGGLCSAMYSRYLKTEFIPKYVMNIIIQLGMSNNTNRFANRDP